MGSRFRPLSIVALALLLLALPGVGLAAGSHFGFGGSAGPSSSPGPQVVLPGGAAVVAPASVPGASVLTVGPADSYAYDTDAGTTIVGVYASGGYFWYNSNGSDVWTSLRLPAGATIWQIDAYGYRTTTGTQNWYLLDANTVGGGILSTVGSATISSGTGLRLATMTFPSGITLAVGHQWVVDLVGTTGSNGYVGAVVQYTLPALSFVPITPVRVLDSRFARFGGSIVHGSPRTINVKDAINVATGAVTTPDAIPQGAKAVAFNLTVTGTVGGGFVAVIPGTGTTVTASTVNWTTGGATIANGGVVALGSGTAERQLTLVVGGSTASTQAIVDITGYYK